MSLKDLFEKAYEEYSKLLYSGKFYSDFAMEDCFDIQAMDELISRFERADSVAIGPLSKAFSKLKNKAEQAVNVELDGVSLNLKKDQGEVVSDQEYLKIIPRFACAMAELQYAYADFQKYVKEQYTILSTDESENSNKLLLSCLKTLNSEINPPEHGSEELNNLRRALNNSFRKDRETSPRGGSPIHFDFK